MFPKREYSITLCATLCASLLCAAAVSALAQQTTTERVPGYATVSTSHLEGKVLLVDGNDLLVKLSTGELKTFHVPETRKFFIDGRELSVHDLRSGTTLTATVKTTTTPVTVRTRSSLSGKVWYVAGTTVILTLADGQNKQYVVKDNVRFMVEGRPATVFDLRKGMRVSAEKIVEEPSVEITADTRVVGHAPVAPLQAAAPQPLPAAPHPAPAAPEPAPAAPQPAAPETTTPTAAQPAAPETTEPTAAQPAAPETTTPTAAQPTTPETGGGSMSPLLWLGLIALLIVIVVIVVRKSRKKQ